MNNTKEILLCLAVAEQFAAEQLRNNPIPNDADLVMQNYAYYKSEKLREIAKTWQF